MCLGWRSQCQGRILSFGYHLLECWSLQAAPELCEAKAGHVDGRGEACLGEEKTREVKGGSSDHIDRTHQTPTKAASICVIKE